MAITLHLFYTGKGDNAFQFAKEMESKGIADQIRNEKDNLSYKYYQPFDDAHTVLLIDKWTSQEALNAHHGTKMMSEIAKLRNKYDLKMKVEMFHQINVNPENDKYIRK
ncbi:antibiotic biosynthesis monooxygenase [Philodulcilactobacillus myokoensis]|uniref:Antibiotic biosynthesis monooxygenase n=1 Tax=Philodulcilactobacillus myokoensis TaxID=2929573 RepID=A0A9W6AZW9_9LACO|nr:antibiotic biosynthesis monooxygenase [Philodulcilactobacillus myokoensis]GLB46143.1 antibiotic biosynthesis monooxygenase [Philodulcilactobacillus myokoensis]